jgi:protein-tyrosine phosphatase
MDSLDEVVKGLYIGDAYTAGSLPTLKKYEITHIVVAGAELTQSFPGEFEYMQFPIRDLVSFDISQYFAESNQFISHALAAGGHILIHCAQGVSRSTALAIAYVMSAYKVSYLRAKTTVENKHEDTRPNSGFVLQLQAYEQLLSARTNECCMLF